MKLNKIPHANAFTILSLLMTLMFSGCATGDLFGNFNLMSPAQEQEMGDNIARQIAEEKTIITDPEINQYINAIGERISAVSRNPERVYNFYVIEEPSINAFAIPGNHLYIHTGLIEASNTEAELASVMAHELGHSEERHPTEQLSRAMGTQMLMEIVLGERANQAVQTAANLAMRGGLSSYSRSAELQADRIAVRLLSNSGYDPNALVSFFGKLAELEAQQGGGGGASLFASHPPTQERINAANNLIQQLQPVPSQTSLVGGLESIKAKLQ